MYISFDALNYNCFKIGILDKLVLTEGPVRIYRTKFIFI